MAKRQQRKRPSIYRSPNKRERIEKMLDDGLNSTEIMTEVDCSRQYVSDVRIRYEARKDKEV